MIFLFCSVSLLQILPKNTVCRHSVDGGCQAVTRIVYLAGNIRQLKNITEQISIIETNREITAEILRGYLPVQPVSKFPTLLGGVKPQGEKSFQSEREILYQVLFDLRRDVTELKKLVHDIMAERAAGGTVTAPSSMPYIISPKLHPA